VQFTCPQCQSMNKFTLSAPKEEEKFVAKIPSWWQKTPAMNESELLSVSKKKQDMIQRLVDKTWKNITTRDRGYGKVPLKLEIVHVQQNHNLKLWTNYCRARESIRKRMLQQGGGVMTKTSEILQHDVDGELLGTNESDVNEALLFHGTKPSACENICKSDFMINMAGSAAGSLYGPGIYFGENSSKSDEYASDDNSGIYAGLFAMLLCRVTCGKPLINEQVNPDTTAIMQACKGAAPSHHSVIGDREKARGTYREFIVFNADQAYPEYVIIYKRVTEE